MSTSTVSDRREPLLPRPVLLLALSVGLLLLAGAGHSLWVDEAISAAVARSSWGDMWDLITQREAAMGLFYVLLHPWSLLTDSELWLRALPVLFAVAAIPVTYLMARRVAGKTAAAISILLLIVHNLFLYEATEIRAYSLGMLLAAGSSLCFLKASEEGSAGTWAAYSVVSALAIYAHMFSTFVVIAHVLAALLAPRRRSIEWRALAASIGGCLIFIAPLVAYAMSHGGGQIDWIERPGLTDLGNTIAVVAGGLQAGLSKSSVYLLAGGALVVLYATSIAFAVFNARRDDSPERWNTAFLVLTSGLPLVGGWAFSVLVQPILQARYLVVALPTLAILVALGISQLDRKVVRTGFVAAIVVFSLLPRGGCYLGCERENWRDATSYLASESRPTDGLVVYEPFTHIAYDYYAQRHDAMPRLLYPRGDDFVARATGPQPLPAVFLDQTDSYERVWLILSHANTGRGLGRSLLQGLSDRRGAPDEATFRGVRVLLFD